MGKKRKHERTEEEILRKIQKLKNQLEMSTNEPECFLPEESLNQPEQDTPFFGSPYCEFSMDNIQYEETQSHLPSPSLPTLHPLPRATSPDNLPQLAPSPPPPPPPPLPPQSSTSDDKAEEVELDDDILQLLGDAPKAVTPLGPPIHKDVGRRWQDVLAKGLPKEVKENLLKNYLVPNNCDLLLAPALNPEVKAALPEALVKRDSSLMYKQKQLGIALSALATVTEMVINNETSKQKILKPLSDACRILCDSHFTETRTRRGFVISTINAKLKDALIESSRDKLLFGENVSEKLKVAKSIQQSGEALKNVQKPRFQRPNVASTSVNKGHLNFVPQHRRTDNKPNNSRKTTNYSQRQLPNNSARRPPDRDRPPVRTSAAHPRR